ncbi:MAG: chromate transporter, partial [Candidatus Omnitrophica bacterium CG11_big_fil_rev_8_21_14_0_20_43_6]
MIYLNLFLEFMKIGAFTFGGGYAMIPLIEKEIVNKYQWLTMKQFTDLIAIAEM